MPTVGVVLSLGGAIDVRELAAKGMSGWGSHLILPPDVLHHHPELARLSAELLRGYSIIGSSDPIISEIDGIVTFSDELVETAGSCAARLGLPWGVPSGAVDKYQQRVTLADAGLTQVRAAPARDLDELRCAIQTLGSPGLVKSRRGHGGQRVREVAGAAMVERVMPELGEWAYYETAIPEGRASGTPYWLGDMVSVEVAAPRIGEPVAVAAFSKLPVHRTQETVTSGPHRLVTTGNMFPWAPWGGRSQETMRLAERAVRALDLRGLLTHVEIKWGADGPDIVEVNCRMGGHLAAVSRAAGGPDLVAIAMAMAVGGEPPPPFEPSPSESNRPRRRAVGVRIPFPRAVENDQLVSEVARADFGNLDGLDQIVTFRSHGRRDLLTDDYAVNLVLTAEHRRELEMRLASAIDRVASLYASDGVGSTTWIREFRSALADSLEGAYSEVAT